MSRIGTKPMNGVPWLKVTKKFSESCEEKGNLADLTRTIVETYPIIISLQMINHRRRWRNRRCSWKSSKVPTRHPLNYPSLILWMGLMVVMGITEIIMFSLVRHLTIFSREINDKWRSNQWTVGSWWLIAKIWWKFVQLKWIELMQLFSLIISLDILWRLITMRIHQC